MSLAAQAKVLRALQENRISRVGSDKDIEVDVRVVAATNKNLRREIEAGRFREDLYHRLSVIVIRVPALRERAGDIPLLVDYFIGKICEEYGIKPKAIEPGAIEELGKMEWSGNVRELRNVVDYSQRANHFSRGCAGLCGGCAVRRSSYIFYKHTNIYFNKIYCDPSAGSNLFGLCRGTAFVAG